MMSTLPRNSPSSSVLLVFAVSGCLLVASSGCRSARDNQIDILERELRSQEDYIYELEEYVVTYSDKLRQCRCVDHGETVIYSDAKALAPVNDPETEKEESPTVEEPVVEEPVDEEPVDEEPEDLNIPDLEISEPVGNNAWSSPDSRVVQAGHHEPRSLEAKVLFVPDPAHFAQDVEGDYRDDEQFADAPLAISADDSVGEAVSEDHRNIDLEPPTVDDRSAENLIVAQLLRGTDDSEHPGSLLAVVEARDSKDEPVDLEGEVSLMVMTADPESPKRLRRWDFTGEETTTAWQSSALGDGLHLELPLGDAPLPNSGLELWVRLVSPDGGKLFTQFLFDPQGLPAIGNATPMEENVTEEKPLLAQLPLAEMHELSDPKVDLAPVDIESTPSRLPHSELEFNSLRPAAARDAAPKPEPRWRASMERSHPLSESYSTTARRVQGWSAQRTASGLQQAQPARPVRRASMVQSVPGQSPD